MENDRNNRPIVASCPKCGKQIVFFANTDNVIVTCPECKSVSAYVQEKLILYANTSALSGTPITHKNSASSELDGKKKKGKKPIITALVIVAIIGAAIFLYSNRHIHSWKEATCDSPMTCTTCGKTQGEAKGHMWRQATCTSPKTCSICGATEGKPKGHSWIAATCTTPKTCSVCGKTEGEALDHNWIPPTCTEEGYCERCKEKNGNPLGHSWTRETSTTPSTCRRCGDVKPMATPLSGKVFLGSTLKRDSELTIKTANYPVFVKLKNSSKEDVFSFFVRANSNTTVEVPSGYYYVYFACGNDWYGPKLYFGNNTTFSKDKEIKDFETYTYTYTLKPVVNGNFTETPVSKEEFD